MFVLLFGLMGVAAVFPVANHYITKGEEAASATATTTAGFDEIRSRGLLRPEYWLYAESSEQQDNAIFSKSTFFKRYFIQPKASTQFSMEGITPPMGLPEQFNNPIQPLTMLAADIPGPGHAFVIDPMGTADGIASGVDNLDLWPWYNVETDALNEENPWNSGGATWVLTGVRWPIRRITLQGNESAVGTNTMTTAVADKIFTLRDDLALDEPKDGALPMMVQWKVDQNGNAMLPGFTGAYSWMVTVVPTTEVARAALQPADSGYGNYLYDVSLITFHRRVSLPSKDSERLALAELLPGGELMIYSDTVDKVDAAMEDIREGNWIALCGVNQTTGGFLMKWYKLLSLSRETESTYIPSLDDYLPARSAYLAGPDWPMPDWYLTNNNNAIPDLRAVMVPGVVNVTTRQESMETPSSWSIK